MGFSRQDKIWGAIKIDPVVALRAKISSSMHSAGNSRISSTIYYPQSLKNASRQTTKKPYILIIFYFPYFFLFYSDSKRHEGQRQRHRRKGEKNLIYLATNFLHFVVWSFLLYFNIEINCRYCRIFESVSLLISNVYLSFLFLKSWNADAITTMMPCCHFLNNSR